MTTFNRTYRAPKFFLCVHTTQGPYIGYEPAEERFTQFTYSSYGFGRLHALVENNFETLIFSESKTLYFVEKYINCNVVGQSEINSRIISFNSWKKDDKWKAKLLTNGTIKSNEEYSCIVCLEGSLIIDGKEIKELEYADLIKNKEYSIIMGENSYAGLFEMCS